MNRVGMLEMRQTLVACAFAAIVFAVNASGSLMGAQRFVIDPAHTEVSFEVAHLMISTVHGSFKAFSGGFEFDEKTGDLKDVSVTIDAATIDTREQKRDDHLRSPDFFDVKAHKDITFKDVKVLEKKDGKPVKIVGQLTMRGVTKSVELASEYKGSVEDPWGNKKMAFVLTGAIERKDFGLNWNKAMDKGGFLVGDRVTIKIVGEAGVK